MKKSTDDKHAKQKLLLTILLLSVFVAALFLTSCAGNKTEITLTGNSNTVNTAATTEKKSDTNLDAAGAGAGNGGVTGK